MKYWTEYDSIEPIICGKKTKYDNNIYTFDIETTSYFVLDKKIYPAIKYKDLSKENQEKCEFGAFMYIWQLGVNDIIYYGRTFEELEKFLDILNDENVTKILFIHNASFEFQFLRGYFEFKKVFARKKRHVMLAFFSKYNIKIQCTYYMSNASLSNLTKLFLLPIEKKLGDLDYNIIRNSKTKLTDVELGYCEYDCLVLYEYIKKELLTYKFVYKIPKTSTGKVRLDLKNAIKKHPEYRRKVKANYDVNGRVYNLLVECFAGGYTHASYIYANKIIENVDSYDETSAYPYVMVAENEFPISKFVKINIKNVEELDENYCYIMRCRFEGVQSKFYNNFISMSKCRHIKNGIYDNGRIISADSLEISLTEIDLDLFRKAYKIEKIEIIDCYQACKGYLPKLLVEFILEKYVLKTNLKGVEGKELDYMKEKNKFNRNIWNVRN